MNRDILRESSLFSGLSDDDLEWLLDNSEVHLYPAGERLIEQGSEGDSAYVILDGVLEVQIRTNVHDVIIAVREAGQVIGEMALIEKSPRTASVTVLRDSQLLRIPQETFEKLLTTSPTAALGVLRTVMDRLRGNEALLHHHEKMAALGTLSAGLAHELNNPAAAATRSTSILQGTIAEWNRLSAQLFRSASQADHAAWLAALQQEVLRRSEAPAALDPIERLNRGDRVQTWLEKKGIEPAWELAPALVSLNWDPPGMEALIDEYTKAGIEIEADVFIRWLATSGALVDLFNELRISTERISEIVKAMKSYTHLDQAPVQEVDVHAGLENTLTILQHKLKQGIHIHREYTPNLPRIEAYASELNQVWTNIIDNSADAMDGNGELTVRTFAQRDNVVVEIEDNGPGIPPAIQPRIFEAFFTTKPPGSGTGLGLHIAYNIVVQRHRGTIEVESQPGRTCFKVSLPTIIPKD